MPPALTVLRSSLPFTRIIVMAPPGAAGLPVVDAVIERGDREEGAYIAMIAALSCKAAVIFTGPGRSPHPDAYRCYLAGIPLRMGESCEFAGAVLSHWIKPGPAAEPGGRYVALAEKTADIIKRMA